MLGIKDTDDAIVSATLRALADLVAHLGSSTVIGGTRLKLFANGAPKTMTGKKPAPSLTSYIPLSCKRIEVRRNSLEVALSPTLNIDDNRVNHLPERHDPDGGEDAATCPAGNPERVSSSVMDDFEGEWSDWESEEVPQPEAIQPDGLQSEVFQSDVLDSDVLQSDVLQSDILQSEVLQLEALKLDTLQSEAIQSEVPQPEVVAVSVSTPSKNARTSKKVTALQNNFDLSTLDIQVKAKENVEEEIDFFADMQPTITKSVYVAPLPITESNPSETTRLNFGIQQEEEANDGWNWEED